MKNLISKPLTEMQKEFSRLHVENVGRLSNTECAIRAGYKPESAYQRAHELLNPKICPHVVQHIAERREEFLKKNNVDIQNGQEKSFRLTGYSATFEKGDFNKEFLYIWNRGY